MVSLTEHIAKFIRDGQGKKYLLGYSGGLDSHVLLHLFAGLRADHLIDLRAIHINHSVNARANDWAIHCAAICHRLNVELLHQTIHPGINQNLEEQLRQLRYQLFENHLTKNEILLTAHHQNDQAETILLQLCRGAGPQGLSAMPRIKTIGLGWHARPLLDVTREDLLHYAKHHQLNWIEDESNANSQMTRNFLRHEVIPILQKRWPTVTKTFARAADHCADAQQFIEMSAEALFKQVQGSTPDTLSVKKLLILKEIEQRQVLRYWIDQAKFILPSTVKMQQLLKTLLQARADKMPHVAWGNVEIRRYRDELFLMEKLGQHDPNQVIPWNNMLEPLILSHIGVLKADPSCSSIYGKITVRFRTGGEIVRLPGRQHHHELKKLFQTWGVPPWMRDRIPLIYVDEVLVGVVGFVMTEHNVFD